MYAHTRACVEGKEMGYFATIEKKDIVAVCPISKINPYYLADSEQNKYLSSKEEKVKSVVITAKSGSTVCYGTKLSAKTLEKKLNTKFFLNI